MSIDSLIQPIIYWTETGADPRTETLEVWFAEFDRVLVDFNDQQLSLKAKADTWYLVNDDDVIFLDDPSPSRGLDTWDF